MAAQAYLKLGEVSVESGKLNMAVLQTLLFFQKYAYQI